MLELNYPMIQFLITWIIPQSNKTSYLGEDHDNTDTIPKLIHGNIISLRQCFANGILTIKEYSRP